ncbi:hypothetical protein PPL_06082 [Heterostelium album PN500]|uniref:Uncharacterized protein n=1 Tax=Heterostelium pallidum (strain ATCC 26659 / Pp 5 / PN500) TaxID=670386 RepID=D3BC60_HETP5|nr:hypothetical protein PPL_06082 [Heterostelium album PN500]EFA81243.1 hypothetical protein PPL_06082 [Heterostelium album PN500]|eukprot:XP_020433361.1 hypothetical protein PPL_06082 [Heterostelium album PN500]
MSEKCQALLLGRPESYYPFIPSKHYCVVERAAISMSKMSDSSMIGMVTAIYFGVGLLLSIYPFYVKDKALCRVAIMTTVTCCWLLWIFCFMSQMNPMAVPEPQQQNVPEGK